MLVVKNNYIKQLNYPISKKLFGVNKTWRGFVVVPFNNALALFSLNMLLQLYLNNALVLGFILGLAYILFELPNSFIKRRLGIPPGAKFNYKGMSFSLIDKMDSAFGVCLIYVLIGDIHYKYGILLFISSVLMHILISKLLVEIKIKKSF
jgi:CDP-diacylglycerol--serine O-phosphatidyltransferase